MQHVNNTPGHPEGTGLLLHDKIDVDAWETPGSLIIGERRGGGTLLCGNAQSFVSGICSASQTFTLFLFHPIQITL